MASQVLVLCGGTGTHVGVAFARLFGLLEPFGFVRAADFPSIFVIDEDEALGADQRKTPRAEMEAQLHAIQASRRAARLEKAEPFDKRISRVGALPKSMDRNISNAAGIFRRSESATLADAIFSDEQLSINPKVGMMCQPALGSLLFELKRLDQNEQGDNRDSAFADLLNLHANTSVVIAGSAVGGTGASIGPTIAQLIAKSPSRPRVLNTMLLKWFELTPTNEAQRAAADARNRLMEENQHSALSFYGEALCSDLAVLPISPLDPDNRTWEGDVNQSYHEHFTHLLGATAALRHFASPLPPGLCYLVAADPNKITGDFVLAPDSRATVDWVVAAGESLVGVLLAYIAVLRSDDGNGQPSALSLAVARSDAAAVASSVETIVKAYSDSLAWLRSIAGVPTGRARIGDCLLDSEVAKRLRERPLPRPSAQADDIADQLFQWTADWVAEVCGSLAAVGAAQHSGHYLPRTFRDQSNALARGYAGQLHRLSEPSAIEKTVGALVDRRNKVTARGVPSFLALQHMYELWLSSSDYFTEEIAEHLPLTSPILLARRRWQLLLLGLVGGLVRVQRLHQANSSVGEGSIERLLQHRQRTKEGAVYRGLGEWLLILNDDEDSGDPDVRMRAKTDALEAEHEKVVGVLSPTTLVLPSPDPTSAREHLPWKILHEILIDPSAEPEWNTLSKSGKHGPERLSTRGKEAAGALRRWFGTRVNSATADSLPAPFRLAFEGIWKNQSATIRNQPFGVANEYLREWEWHPAKGVDAIKVPVVGPVSDDDADQSVDVRPFDSWAEIYPELKKLNEQGGAWSSVLIRTVDDNLTESRTPLKRFFWFQHLQALSLTDGGDRTAQNPIASFSLSKPKPGQPFCGLNLELFDRTINDYVRVGWASDVIVGTTSLPAEYNDEGFEALNVFCDRLARIRVTDDQGQPTDEFRPLIPLKTRFLGLLAGPSGESWLDAWFDGSHSEPVIDVNADVWAVQLLGHARGGEKKQDRRPKVVANVEGTLRVWPNFRVCATGSDSTSRPEWSAYYYRFDHNESEIRVGCVKGSIRHKVAYRTCFHSNMADVDAGPLGIASSDKGLLEHAPGAPVVLTFYEPDPRRSGSPIELGSILPGIGGRRGMRVIGTSDSSQSVAIDFGTSNTAFAYQKIGEDVGSDREKAIDFIKITREMAPGNERTLTTTIFANHVSFPSKILIGEGQWLPTYAETGDRYLLSELIFVSKPVGGDALKQLVPIRDYSIPNWNINIEKRLGVPTNWVVGDFKWKATGALAGSEDILQRMYLSLATEIFLADMISSQDAAPAAPVRFTFTYPLRLRSVGAVAVDRFRALCTDVVDALCRQTGLKTQSIPELYNESDAAASGLAIPGEVRLVADLGGGTLDLYGSSDDYGPDGASAEFFTTSVMLGANKVIERIVDHEATPSSWDEFVPGQSKEQRREALISLFKAVLRAEDGGAAKLLSDTHAQTVCRLFDGRTNRQLDIPGYGPADRVRLQAAKNIVDRYLALVTDAVARNAAIFLSRLPGFMDGNGSARARRIHVALRGNGWRIEYAPDSTEIVANIGRCCGVMLRTLASDGGIDSSRIAEITGSWQWVSRDVPVSERKIDAVRNAVARTDPKANAGGGVTSRRSFVCFALGDRGPGSDMPKWYSALPFPRPKTPPYLGEVYPPVDFQIDAQGQTLRNGLPTVASDVATWPNDVRSINDELRQADTAGKDLSTKPVDEFVYERLLLKLT